MDNIKQHYYDGFSMNQSEVTLPRMKKVLEVINQINRNNTSRILDMGCGDGTFTQSIMKALNPQQTYGIDISPVASKKASQLEIDSKALDIDNDNLPFENNYFDFIYCGGLIELVCEPDHLLEELHRVLSSDGFLIITHSNICSWGSRLAVLLGYHPFYDRISRRYDLGKMLIPLSKGASTGFIRMYTPRSFKQMMALYNFQVLKTIGAEEPALPGFLRKLDSFLSKYPPIAFQNIHLVKPY